MTIYDLEYERAVRSSRKTLEFIREQIKDIEDTLTSIDWAKEDGETIERPNP